MTRHSLDCQTALVIFRITHEDRAGQTSTDTLRQGEIVGTVNGEAVIAAESGDIMRVPVTALHRVKNTLAGLSQSALAPDFIAGQALTRFFPPDGEAFTCRWLGRSEILEAAAVSMK